MTQKHSQLPFSARQLYNQEAFALFRQDGGWSRRLDDLKGGFSEKDATFIVRACNNHYKLVEALKWAMPFLEDGAIGDGRYAYDQKLKQAKQALAEAEAA